MCEKLNSYSKEIEEILIKDDNCIVKTLPIDMFYILGKRLIYRTRDKNNKGLACNIESILNFTGEFAYIKDLKDEDYTFLLYIGAIIDFIINENLNREPSQFLAHVVSPEILKQKFLSSKNK